MNQRNRSDSPPCLARWQLGRDLWRREFPGSNVHALSIQSAGWWFFATQPIWKICSSKWYSINLPQFLGWKIPKNSWVATTQKEIYANKGIDFSCNPMAWGWDFSTIFLHINHTDNRFWGMSTLQGTNISPKNGILKMIFLFPRWPMLIPWRVPLWWSFRSLHCDWKKVNQKHVLPRPWQALISMVIYQGTLREKKISPTKTKQIQGLHLLVGGWTNPTPLKNICSSKWVHLPQFSGVRITK